MDRRVYDMNVALDQKKCMKGDEERERGMEC